MSLLIANQLGCDRDDIVFTFDGNQSVDSCRSAHQLHRIGVLVHGICLAILGLVVEEDIRDREAAVFLDRRSSALALYTGVPLDQQ